MDLTGSVALVTGANRGLGAHLVAELLGAGAAKVYATSRRNARARYASPAPSSPRRNATPLRRSSTLSRFVMGGAGLQRFYSDRRSCSPPRITQRSGK